MRAGWMVALVSVCAGAAAAQEADPDAATQGEALMVRLGWMEAQACLFGGEVELVLLMASEEGQEPIGAWDGAALAAEDGRTLLTRGTDVLQMDGANSIRIVEGRAETGSCRDATQELGAALTLAVGGDPDDAAGMMRATLWRRVEEAEARAEREIAAARADAERRVDEAEARTALAIVDAQDAKAATAEAWEAAAAAQAETARTQAVLEQVNEGGCAELIQPALEDVLGTFEAPGLAVSLYNAEGRLAFIAEVRAKLRQALSVCGMR